MSARRATRSLVLRVLRRGAPLEPEELARRAGLHPEMVLRLTRLGLIEPAAWEAGRPRAFPAETVRRIRRIERLHRDLGLSYHAVGVVLELLERVERLERELERARGRG